MSRSVDLLFWIRIESFLPAVGGGFVTTAQQVNNLAYWYFQQIASPMSDAPPFQWVQGIEGRWALEERNRYSGRAPP